MAEKPRDLWQVPHHWLRDRRLIGEIGVKCNGCGHSHSWPIGELMQEHGPHTLVSDLWRQAGRFAPSNQWDRDSLNHDRAEQ